MQTNLGPYHVRLCGPALILVLAVAWSPLTQDRATQPTTLDQRPITTNHAGRVQATKPSDEEIVLTGPFAAPRQAVFDALTQAKHLVRWMTPTNMALVACEVEARVGGTFRYVFQRPSGRKLEVRGTYTAFDPPRRFEYTETYDFSPLTVQATTALEAVNGETVFKQTLRYSSKQERDADFDAVARSAKEIYPNLARYLAQGAR